MGHSVGRQVLHMGHTAGRPVLHMGHSVGRPVLHMGHTVGRQVLHMGHSVGRPVLHMGHTVTDERLRPFTHCALRSYAQGLLLGKGGGPEGVQMGGSLVKRRRPREAMQGDRTSGVSKSVQKCPKAEKTRLGAFAFRADSANRVYFPATE
eukprot:1175679-Prorocentrum_minimum.AAC.1